MTSAEQRADYVAYYRELKRLGICPRCKTDVPAGRVYHKHCQRAINAKANASKNAWRTRKLEAGLCIACGNAPLVTQTMCDACRRRHNGKARYTRTTDRRPKCLLCRDRGHNKRTCPRRFRVNVIEYAVARAAVEL